KVTHQASIRRRPVPMRSIATQRATKIRRRAAARFIRIQWVTTIRLTDLKRSSATPPAPTTLPMAFLPSKTIPPVTIISRRVSKRSQTTKAAHRISPWGLVPGSTSPLATPQFGLIAEDVEKVNRDLVSYDETGKVYTVRYEAVNAMLLNEFLKEHRKVQTLEATVAHQQKQIEALTATVQKVSDQVALSKPAPQLVANP